MSSHHDPETSTLLFEHARDILLVIDAESGRIIDANAAAELAYGYTRDQLLTLTIFQIRAADILPVAMQMKQANTDGILFEALHQRCDGTAFPVEVNSRGHTIGDRRVLLSVVRDITDRRRLEAEREALIATTQHALSLRDEFLVIASHELRSPVTTVSLQLQQILRMIERAESAPQLAASTQTALNEIARLSSLITMLLDAQAAAGRIALALGPVNLAQLVQDIAVRLRPRALLAGSDLTVDIPPVNGNWDRIRLDQVFTNLLINALKYGCGRPISIRGSLVGDTSVRVDVQDHGIGIAREDTSRIFEMFERAVPPAYGGLGLGLYITRQLVEAHGGSVVVESAVGEGSVFQVTLPLSGQRAV